MPAVPGSLIVPKLSAAPSSPVSGQVYYDTTTNQFYWYNGTVWITARLLGSNYATSLPSSPHDGQEAVLVDSTTNPTYNWRFRYNSSSSSTYKWEFVGGTLMTHEVATDESTASTTYVDLTTVGPTLTLPRAGDYQVQFGAGAYNQTGNNSQLMAIKRGATATSDNDCSQSDAARTFGLVPLVRGIRINAMAASDVVKCQYRTTAGTANWRNRWMTIQPFRVS